MTPLGVFYLDFILAGTSTGTGVPSLSPTIFDPRLLLPTPAPATYPLSRHAHRQTNRRWDGQTGDVQTNRQKHNLNTRTWLDHAISCRSYAQTKANSYYITQDFNGTKFLRWVGRAQLGRDPARPILKKSENTKTVLTLRLGVYFT